MPLGATTHMLESFGFFSRSHSAANSLPSAVLSAVTFVTLYTASDNTSAVSSSIRCAILKNRLVKREN